MQSIFASCHMCGSLDNEFIMHVVLDDQSLCPLQKVYICTRCGLIYRNPTIPSRSQFKYGASAWDGNPYYLEKSIETCKLLLDFFQNKGKPKIILEIGAGHGHLSMQLVKAFPDALLVICEPSEQCAFILASKLPNALVFPCTLDEISNLSLHPDIVIACGVDYLFHHHRSAINNIYNILNNGGVFYVERNAFTTINKYLGDNRKKITKKKDKFFPSPLLTNWFHPEQYEQYLNIWFSVYKKIRFPYDNEDGIESSILGFLCEKEEVLDAGKFFNGEKSWYKANRDIIDILTD